MFDSVPVQENVVYGNMKRPLDHLQLQHKKHEPDADLRHLRELTVPTKSVSFPFYRKTPYGLLCTDPEHDTIHFQTMGLVLQSMSCVVIASVSDGVMFVDVYNSSGIGGTSVVLHPSAPMEPISINVTSFKAVVHGTKTLLMNNNTNTAYKIESSTVTDMIDSD